MRYIKIASDKNPINDYIELNDLQGYFCTSLQSLGFSRKIEYLKIQNRQDSVDNQVEFRDYSLTIEILTNYANFEPKYRELITFLDRNKKNGLRLYYRPYNNMEMAYILCDIKSFTKTEKRQPVQLIVTQKSLWLSDEKKGIAESEESLQYNMFAFTHQKVVIDENILYDENGNLKENFTPAENQLKDYYCSSYYEDSEIDGYYCMNFVSGISTRAHIIINSYNEIPLIIRIKGQCVNPTINLFKGGEDTPIRSTTIYATINQGYYVEINPKIFENGIWFINETTGEKIDYSELVNNSSSPYFFVDNGEYYIEAKDTNNNAVSIDVLWQEEYS